ncbi:MAG: hypothetical protein HZB72_08975 [Burkholderiales bacterium]|nr:hypothetical protein [Burkholderiales bacterium]
MELRERGRRRRGEALDRARCRVGDLEVHHDRSMQTGRRQSLALLVRDTEPLLPTLYEPRMLRMEGARFILAGRQWLPITQFERRQYEWFDQEWLCIAWIDGVDPGHPADTLLSR